MTEIFYRGTKYFIANKDVVFVETSFSNLGKADCSIPQTLRLTETQRRFKLTLTVVKPGHFTLLDLRSRPAIWRSWNNLESTKNGDITEFLFGSSLRIEPGNYHRYLKIGSRLVLTQAIN